MKTRLLHIALLIFCLLLPTSSRAADFGAAFLESGIGGRALGMGSAFAAVADDASASYWNPAGLIRAHGKVFLASHQPLSLDRQHDSISFALNLRRELGFGITWLHAGVNNIEGRTTDGRPTGDIEDAANAYYVSVGRALGRRLANEADGVVEVGVAVGRAGRLDEANLTSTLGARHTGLHGVV